MGFLGDGAIGHGAGFKAGDNRVHAFHFLQGNPFFRIFEIHQAPQVFDGIFVIHQGRILLEEFVIPSSGGLLQCMDSGRIVEMFIAAASHFMMSRAVQSEICGKAEGVEGHGVEVIHFLFHIL